MNKQASIMEEKACVRQRIKENPEQTRLKGEEEGREGREGGRQNDDACREAPERPLFSIPSIFFAPNTVAGRQLAGRQRAPLQRIGRRDHGAQPQERQDRGEVVHVVRAHDRGGGPRPGRRDEEGALKRAGEGGCQVGVISVCFGDVVDAFDDRGPSGVVAPVRGDVVGEEEVGDGGFRPR